MNVLQPKIKVNVSMDGREIQIRVRRGVKAPLGRIAGRVRMIARRSLKAVPARSARKNPSKPGEQPHSIFARNKGGHRMRKMWYAEQQPGQWVVGPHILMRKNGTYQSLPTPAIHEHGGTKAVTIKHLRKMGKKTTPKQRAAFRRKVQRGEITWSYRSNALRGRVVTTHKVKTFPRRPFMEPALKKIIPIMPQMFKNSIKK